MNRGELILRYSAFALVSTLVNLGMQRLIFLFGDDVFILAFAIFIGTISGLIVKYILDRRWIFYDRESGIINHTKKFSIYTLMGVVTTAIFWSAEASFWWIWKSNEMRELGALVGLLIGYIVKYNLDRRYVFIAQPVKITP